MKSQLRHAFTPSSKAGRCQAPQSLRQPPSRADGGPRSVLGIPLSLHPWPTLSSPTGRAGRLGALTHGKLKRAQAPQPRRWHSGVRLCSRRRRAVHGVERGKVFAFPRDSCSAGWGLRKPFAPWLSSKSNFSLCLCPAFRLDADQSYARRLPLHAHCPLSVGNDPLSPSRLPLRLMLRSLSTVQLQEQPAAFSFLELLGLGAASPERSPCPHQQSTCLSPLLLWEAPPRGPAGKGSAETQATLQPPRFQTLPIL